MSGRDLHNEELHNPHSSPNISRAIKSRRIRWAGHVARTGERSGAYRVYGRGPEGKRQHGRPRRKWEDSIKTDLQEVMDRTDLSQVRERWRALVNWVRNFRVIQNARNFLTN